MTFEEVVKIIDEHIKKGGTRVTLSDDGLEKGEYINETIMYAKKRGLKVSVLSKGMIFFGVMPNKVSINTKEFFKSESAEKLTTALDYYLGKTDICLHYNVEKKDNHNVFVKFGRLALKYKASVIFSPMQNYAISKKLGKNIFDFACFMQYCGVPAQLDGIREFCLFSPFELAYLKENFQLKSEVFSQDLIKSSKEKIYPVDMILNIFTSQKEPSGFPKKSNDYFRELFKCRKCYFFQNNKCQSA